MAKFTDPGEVVKAYNTFHSDTTQTALRSRWNQDFNLYRLRPYDAGRGYYSYTHNYPRTFADKAVSMIATSKLLIRIPSDILGEKERQKAGAIERLLYGSFTVNDEDLVRMGLPKLRDQMAWYICVRGGFLMLDLMQKGNKGETKPFTRVYDLYNSAYEVGENQLNWAVMSRQATRAELLQKYKVQTGAQEPIVYRMVDDENYGLVYGGQWLEGPEPHGLDHCPVHIALSGSMPQVRHEGYTYTDKHRGESIFAGLREVAPQIDKTMSDMVTLVRRGVKPPIGVWSAGAEKSIEADIYQVEKGSAIQLDSLSKEDVRPLITPSSPADTGIILKWMSGDEQRAGFPYTVFGELGFRLSGYAINQLQSSIMTVIAPFVSAVETAYVWSCREKLEQFSSGKYEPVKVRGRTSRNEPFGYPSMLTIKPSEIEKDWYPEVTLNPILPKDDAQRYLLAQAAREGEIPLLDDNTIRDEILGLEDPELVESKVHRQWSKNLPILKLYRAFQAAIQDDNYEEAQNLLVELEIALNERRQRQQATGGQPSVRGRLQTEAMGTPGAGMPTEGMGGIPPEVVPPEAMGGLPAGAMGAGGI